MEPDRRVALKAYEILRKRRRSRLLSALLPGLGQIYERRYISGLSFLTAFSFPFYYWYLLGFPINYGSLTLLGAQGLLYGLQLLDAAKGAGRETSPCEDFCPARVKVPSFMACCEEGKPEEGFGIFFLSAPFPFTLGELCPAPCEKRCGILPERPLKIREVHREMGRAVLEKLQIEKRDPFFPETEKRVAVIGGGVAGITAAYYLSSAGVQVDLFEKEEELGGVINYVPEFKVEREIVKKEIEYALSFKNLRVFRGREVKERPEGYDWVVIAVGASREKRLKGIEGENVIYPMEFLKSPPDLKGKRLAVIGAGDTAVDVARLGVRMGGEVYIFYRGKAESIRAQERELSLSVKEGVRIYTNCTVVGVEGRELRLSCGSFSYDYLIPALGFEVDRELIERLSGEKTSVTGDAATGMTTFVEACGRARKTAAEVLKRLGLSERAWFTVDIYREKPERVSGENLFIVSESSLCQHCGIKVKS